MKFKKKNIKTFFKEIWYVKDTAIPEKEETTVEFKDGTTTKYISKSIYNYKQIVGNEPLFNQYATLLFENKSKFD